MSRGLFSSVSAPREQMHGWSAHPQAKCGAHRPTVPRLNLQGSTQRHPEPGNSQVSHFKRRVSELNRNTQGMHPHLTWDSEGEGAMVTDLWEHLAELRVTVVLVSFLGTLPYLTKICPASCPAPPHLHPPCSPSRWLPR